MEDHDLTNMVDNCGDDLANTIVRYEDKFDRLLKPNIIIQLDRIAG